MVKMHKLIEEIQGIEVIADDFLVVGCGETIEEATIDHDTKILSFLIKCTSRVSVLGNDMTSTYMLITE